MISAFDKIAMKFALSLDPETAHAMSIAALRTGLPIAPRPAGDERLHVEAAGLSFPNPLGMAAGYDKNAEAPGALLALGFGSVEVGTLTPRPQTGNPRPRVFRLRAERAVINRMGFNNQGYARCLERLKARRQSGGVVGVNIGANRDSTDRIADYRLGVELFTGHASYLAVNVSSPNTPGLRDLQSRENLGELLSAVMEAREARVQAGAAPTPVFLKIAPDLDEKGLQDIAVEVLDKKLEGVIVSNTALSRAGVSGKEAAEEGGLSGPPIFRRSTALLARARRLLGPGIAIIGSGGVESGDTALEKIRAGADLVQIYTGMIYAGPGLPGRILREMSAFLSQEKLATVAQLRDTRLDHWARVPLA